MKFHYEIIDKENYLLVVMGGEYSLEDMFSMMKAVANECSQKNYTKVFADMRLVVVTDIPVIERFSMGKGVADVFGTRVKVAAIMEARIIHRQRIGEMAATNRFANYRNFSEEEEKEAMDWLFS